MFLSINIYVFSQAGKIDHIVHFSQGKYNVNNRDTDNIETLNKCISLLHKLSKDSLYSDISVEVISYVSPEGSLRINTIIGKKRLLNTVKYIVDNTGIKESNIKKKVGGVPWDDLKKMVDSSDMENAREIVDIIDDIPDNAHKGRLIVDSKNRRLMALDKGKSYRYMMKEFYPFLRRTDIRVSYSVDKRSVIKGIKNKNSVLLINSHNSFLDSAYLKDSLIIKKEKTDTVQARDPLFAIKTNLLYNLSITPNLELEIPIGKRWSINAEYQYGWWLKKDNTFCWQIESGGLEFRKWFGNRNKRRVLTGWFGGVFVSGGIYDFQLKKDQGYQGEFVVITGLSGGYSTSLGKNFRMEFSTGLGYLHNQYTKYRVIANDLYKEGEKMRLQSLMISKAKISIVWIINRKKREVE